MIYVLCSGGIGNQMFQYAYYLHLKKAGRNAVLDTSYSAHNNIHSGYALGRAFGIEKSCTADHFNKHWVRKYKLLLKLHLDHFGRIHMEKRHSLIKEEKIGRNAVLFGYWQGEQFFSDVIDEVMEKFSFINISDRSYDLSLQMSGENSVAVHVRRGDYLKGSQFADLPSTQYYQNAIAVAKAKMDNPRWYVFSDDISWCRQSGLFPEDAYYVDHNDDVHAYEDMFLMSQCKAVIVANSTFSWWGAYLGNHEFVVRPEKFESVWGKDQDDRLYPKDWIVGKFGNENEI